MLIIKLFLDHRVYVFFSANVNYFSAGRSFLSTVKLKYSFLNLTKISKLIRQIKKFVECFNNFDNLLTVVMTVCVYKPTHEAHGSFM